MEVFLRELLLAKESEMDSSQDVIRRKCENLTEFSGKLSESKEWGCFTPRRES